MKFKVTTLGPRYDGVYEWDADKALSTKEWEWIKQFSGRLPETFEDGVGDPTLLCTLAVIAMYRAGKIGKREVATVYEALADAPFDGETISVEGDEQQEDPSPAQETESEPGSEPTGTNGSSGPSSASTSGSQERTPTATGAPG